LMRHWRRSRRYCPRASLRAPMRAPEFWNAAAAGRDTAPMLRALLTPVSWAYGWAVARRLRSGLPHHAAIPVLCVGNFTVGGAGKTPIARALRVKLGAGAHVLSRGYGGRLPGPLRVTADMDAREVGDEPLLHAADGPAWIARDRVAGARAAAAAGARALIMDDGFQNPALHKDLSLIVVDADSGVGNGQVFPAGPLRERLSEALKRADAIVLLHNREPDAEAPRDWLGGFTGPVLTARITPLAAPPAGPLVAFAGLARPDKFFATLEGAGADLAETMPYPDHHQFTGEDLDWLSRLAAERSAQLVTTEKDAARLPPAFRARVAVLPIAACFDDDAALDALLASIRARMS
jgi:tetraacyldisaccharide 4'-kinase